MPTRFLNLEFVLLRPCFLGFGREPYPNFSFEEIDLYFFFVRSACFCVWVVVKRSPSSEGSFSWNFSVILCTEEHKFINISASIQTYDNVSSLLSAIRTFRPAFSTLIVLAWGQRLVDNIYYQSNQISNVFLPKIITLSEVTGAQPKHTHIIMRYICHIL